MYLEDSMQVVLNELRGIHLTIQHITRLIPSLIVDQVLQEPVINSLPTTLAVNIAPPVNNPVSYPQTTAPTPVPVELPIVIDDPKQSPWGPLDAQNCYWDATICSCNKTLYAEGNKNAHCWIKKKGIGETTYQERRKVIRREVETWQAGLSTPVQQAIITVPPVVSAPVQQPVVMPPQPSWTQASPPTAIPQFEVNQEELALPVYTCNQQQPISIQDFSNLCAVFVTKFDELAEDFLDARFKDCGMPAGSLTQHATDAAVRNWISTQVYAYDQENS